MKRIYNSVIFCFLVIFSAFIQAAQIDNIYSSSVAVSSQQISEQQAGFNQALVSVLIKASGQLDPVTSQYQINRMLPAEPYVQSFGYRENPEYVLYIKALERVQEQDNADLPIEDTSPPEETALSDTVDTNLPTDESIPLEPPLPFVLDVHFAPSFVKNRMTELGIPIWGAVRPSVLVWMVTETIGERAILGTSDESPLVELVTRYSLERGVPAFLPVADLEDLSNIDIDDLWGLFPEAVSSASQRYNADANVLFRINHTSDQLWSGNWVLQIKGENYHGAVYDETKEHVISTLVSTVANTLSLKYAINTSADISSNFLNIEVNNITNFEDYVGVQNYLSELSPVSEVNMTRVLGDKIDFKLTLIVSQDKFFEHIELGGKMRRPTSDIEEDIEDSLEKPKEKLIWTKEE